MGGWVGSVMGEGCVGWEVRVWGTEWGKGGERTKVANALVWV